MGVLSKPSSVAMHRASGGPTAAKSRPTPYDRSKSASSVESFSASDELAKLENRISLKLAQGPKPVATPARTSASVPSVASVAPPTKANGAPPIGKGTMVKTEGLGVLPPPVTSLTPVKSPIQKKPKSAMPEQPHVIKRSLCTEMDDAASASSPPMSTVLDSSLEPPPTGKPVPSEKNHSPGDEPACDQNQTPPPPGDDVSDQTKLRTLETLTTIPLGHVDEKELETAMDAKYNQPLFKCLFDSLVDLKEVDIEQLVLPASYWLDARSDYSDIDTIDPKMKVACEKAVDLKTIAYQKESVVKVKEGEREKAIGKINAAAEFMISQQYEKIQKMGVTNVEDSPLFKVNKNNVVVWQGNKIQLLDKAFQCHVDERITADANMRNHIIEMIEMAYETWMETNFNTPHVGVDPELLGELEAIMQEGSPKAAESATPDLSQQRLDDHRQVISGDVGEDNLGQLATPQHVIAKKTLLMRKDTTQLEATAPARVTAERTESQEVITYLGPGGRTETQEEHDRRLAINAKMRFHRSLSSSRCPPAVLERAKGKRHNRQLIGELFESWLSAGEDWMQSSVVANATRSMAQRKRGKYVMMEFRALKTRFGGPLAKQILTEKKQQQENKDANDPLTYWMKHPDVASEDFEMVRIFDSMVYEDEVQDDLTLGICASGNLDASQTRQAMQIAVGGEIEKLQSMGLGMQPGGGGNSVPAAPTEKPKKVTPISKQVTNKISSSSAKLTELMAWESKIKDNTVLSPTLLAGFATELGARKDAITSAKTTLESSYAKTLGKTDAQIQEDKELLETITTSLANVEAAFTSFNGTIKSIKLAIDPPPKKEPKAKAKAKADAAPPA